jgi:hypothetical protein
MEIILQNAEFMNPELFEERWALRLEHLHQR